MASQNTGRYIDSRRSKHDWILNEKGQIIGHRSGDSTEDILFPTAAEALNVNLSADADETNVMIFNDKGTDVTLTPADNVNAGIMSVAQAVKLSLIQPFATLNSTDAILLARANHTGTQLANTISDFSTAADARITLQKAANNGLAPLGADGKVPSLYLPVGTATETNLSIANRGASTLDILSSTGIDVTVPAATTSLTGLLTAADKTLIDTITSKEPALAAGTTAQYYRGDKSWQTLNSTAVGLGNVTNTSDSNKPVSTAQQAALDLKAALASLNIFTETNRGKITAVSFASTITLNFAKLNFDVAVTGNFTLALPTNMPASGDTQSGFIIFRQGATVGSITMASNWKKIGGGTVDALSTTTNTGMDVFFYVITSPTEILYSQARIV